MRTLVVLLALAATVVGGAGAATVLVEQRLGRLSSGPVEFAALHYNPVTGALRLTDVRAHDARGRPVFRAERVTASASVWSLLGGGATLRKVHVVAPRVVLAASPVLELAGFGGETARPAPLSRHAGPLVVEGLMVTGGALLLQDAGEAGQPLIVRDVDLRLSRLAAAPLADQAPAFVVEMAVYGTVVQVTGQPAPAAGGYALRVRARGLDVAALQRDFPRAADALAGGVLERGRAEVDTALLVTDGRVLASGHARLAELAARWQDGAQLTAATLYLALDRFDLVSGTGRVSRLDVGAPVLTLALPAHDLLDALEALDTDGVVVRRLSVHDGTLALTERGRGVTLRSLELAVHARERGDDAGYSLTGQASVGRRGRVSATGLVSRDLQRFDGVVRADEVELAPWTALTSLAAGSHGLLAFEGRARFERGVHAELSGRATLRGFAHAGVDGDFRADTMTLGLRRLDWPSGAVALDSVLLTRPSYTLRGRELPASWPWATTGPVKIVDGELRTPGRTVSAIDAELAPDSARLAARLRLSAAVSGHGLVGIDRWLPYDPGEPTSLSLTTLFSALHDAATPAALPTSVVAP